jgi:DNA-binding NarL/FixJ family response regulator
MQKEKQSAFDPERVEAVRTLSASEYEVFLELSDGLKTSEIAKKRFRSKKTIEAQIGRIKKKLNLPHTDAVQVFAAKFTCYIGKPKLTGRRISYIGDFVYEESQPTAVKP